MELSDFSFKQYRYDGYQVIRKGNGNEVCGNGLGQTVSNVSYDELTNGNESLFNINGKTIYSISIQGSVKDEIKFSFSTDGSASEDITLFSGNNPWQYTYFEGQKFNNLHFTKLPTIVNAYRIDENNGVLTKTAYEALTDNDLKRYYVTDKDVNGQPYYKLYTIKSLSVEFDIQALNWSDSDRTTIENGVTAFNDKEQLPKPLTDTLFINIIYMNSDNVVDEVNETIKNGNIISFSMENNIMLSGDGFSFDIKRNVEETDDSNVVTSKGIYNFVTNQISNLTLTNISSGSGNGSSYTLLNKTSTNKVQWTNYEKYFVPESIATSGTQLLVNQYKSQPTWKSVSNFFKLIYPETNGTSLENYSGTNAFSNNLAFPIENTSGVYKPLEGRYYTTSTNLKKIGTKTDNQMKMQLNLIKNKYYLIYSEIFISNVTTNITTNTSIDFRFSTPGSNGGYGYQTCKVFPNSAYYKNYYIMHPTTSINNLRIEYQSHTTLTNAIATIKRYRAIELG